MSTLEDDIRASMRLHEHEAPDAATFRPHSPRATARWVPMLIAACLVVALAAGLALWRAPSTTRVANPTLSCPQHFGAGRDSDATWVPSTARGVDGKSRLIPNKPAQGAVVCGYLPQDKSALSDKTTITNPGALSSWLTWLPRQTRPTGCTLDLRPHDGDYFLIGLRYADGTIWVSAPGNHCAGSSNGQFVSPANLGGQALLASRSGTWPPNEVTAPCPATQGRLGQESVLVPAGATEVFSCSKQPGSAHTVATLARALDALPTAQAKPSCGRHGDDYVELTFRYRTGPDVQLAVDLSCGWADNQSLSARLTPSVKRLITQFVNRR